MEDSSVKPLGSLLVLGDFLIFACMTLAIAMFTFRLEGFEYARTYGITYVFIACLGLGLSFVYFIELGSSTST